MDAATIGIVGGIAGGFLGLLGGAFGTYCTLRSAKGPRERAFLVKASVVCWVLVLGFVAGMLLMPTWHKHLLWAPYALLLTVGIRYVNNHQQRIRREEAGEA
jgi:hypothetical protein